MKDFYGCSLIIYRWLYRLDFVIGINNQFSFELIRVVQKSTCLLVETQSKRSFQKIICVLPLIYFENNRFEDIEYDQIRNSQQNRGVFRTQSSI